MKKTLIALLAFSGVVSANTTVLTFQSDDLSFATDKWALNGVGNGPGSAWQGSTTLSDGTVATMVLNAPYGGKFWDNATVTASWTNTTALTTMNSNLGTTLTNQDLTDIKIDASAAQNATSALTLNFSDNAVCTPGHDIIFYLLVATSNQGGNTAAYNNFTVTGLDSATVSWAVAGGDGFNTTSINVPVGNLAMIKVEGTLTDSDVTFSSTSAKNGWAMVAYFAPEPATATLSLLALAGLAARRKRH